MIKVPERKQCMCADCYLGAPENSFMVLITLILMIFIQDYMQILSANDKAFNGLPAPLGIKQS